MRRRLVLVVVIGGVLTGGAVASATQGSVIPNTCPSVHYNTTAQSGDGHLHRGDRVNNGMWIESTNASCDRVSSVLVMTNDGTEQVEVGWFDAEGQPTCSYTGTGPRVLWNAVINTVNYCATQTPDAVTKGQYDPFSVDDPNSDGEWVFHHNGSLFKSLHDPDLIQGQPVSNGERHSTADSAYSEFKDLQYDGQSGWTDWSNSGVFSPGSSDPNFCNQFDSDTHIEVVSC